MPQAIPSGLTKKHILLALEDLDAGIEHPFGPPTGYLLSHDDKNYPPKAVVGIAFRHLTGNILSPEEFSGGEAPGQANYVLRNLGFTVEAIAPQSRSFITSRGYVLPTSEDKIGGWVWFNMWTRRLWPYNELAAGNILYWYDASPQVQAIVWKTEVKEVDRFEYQNKEQVRQRFKARFDDDPAQDPYYIKASDQGYCLAYKVTPVEQLNLSKPADFKFPQGGWLRGDDPDAQPWLSRLATLAQDGPFAAQLQATASKAKGEGYFDPKSVEDERQRKLREIVQRRGQPEFRSNLIAAYDGRCAVTGWKGTQALEAAHITPYLGPASNHVSNGLLLRADIHTLFDLDLIGIEPMTRTLVVAEQLHGTPYKELSGKELLLPSDPAQRPSTEALQHRWKAFHGGEQ